MQRQGFLIRRLKWRVEKLLSPCFLLPVYRVLIPDEMNSVILPSDCLSIIGVFDPKSISEGDFIQTISTDSNKYTFFRKNFISDDGLTYDYTRPVCSEQNFLRRGVFYERRENRLFFNQKDIDRIGAKNIGFSILYTRLPKDERGDLVPDFMLECLGSYVSLVILEKDMKLSARGKKEGNMLQLRMIVDEMKREYKFRAKQVRVAQMDLIGSGQQLIPISLQV